MPARKATKNASKARATGLTRSRRVATAVRGVVLTPGAGAGRDHSTLVAVDTALSASGVRVDRVDFPYRKAGRRSPDRPPVLIATVVDAAHALAASLRTGTEHIALGGRSMGGRMCSMAVAEGLPAAALILVSYPLHPPGKPEQLRTDHFGALEVPCLFVSGTRDPFATPDELTLAAGVISGPVTHEWIEGGDHGLRGHDEHVAGSIRDWVLGL